MVGKNEDDCMPINVENVARLFLFCCWCFCEVNVKILEQKNHVEIEGLTIYSFSVSLA